ncbi:hypothetical protein SAMN06265795_101138 [Noviherbaspirillum humi]|uniref:Uncharacterized protein n=1 Tax=Noviherbaspirillum humi TaxID=1688639 RepID=A0A239BZB0_9BURK|nr:hypothetical protein SAMN06265795_101138 [Noviherbaspirillum humi]
METNGEEKRAIVAARFSRISNLAFLASRKNPLVLQPGS